MSVLGVFLVYMSIQNLESSSASEVDSPINALVLAIVSFVVLTALQFIVAIPAVALVMALVDDLNEGVFAIGFGKSRGLGRVKAALVGLDLELIGDGRELRGTAATVSGSEHRLYAGKAEDRIPLSPGLRERLQPSWRGHRLALDKAAEISQVAELLRPRLDAFLVESKKRTTHHARA